MTDPNRTEYKVVPAPERARKVRGLKGAALFAHEIEALMNELASDGWVYVRAETLPQEERAGLTSKTTTYRNLLVFQRATLAVPVTAHARPTVKSPPTLPGPETDAAAAAAAAAARTAEQINAKLAKRTISRHGRSTQRWAADPLSHSAVRLTTGCVPILDGGNILFVSASSKPLWIFPKGGWERDEAQEESALREAFEEAGVLGVLGPKLTEVQYETRKSKKRRLETEELLKKKWKHEPETPTEQRGDPTSPITENNNSNTSDNETTGTVAVATMVASDTVEGRKEDVSPTGNAHHNADAAPVSDEAFARIRGEMMTKSNRHLDETSSIQSDTSSHYSQVRMCLFPLYLTSVKAQWPENGRLRRAVPIDEAIEILEARPELQAALKEVKEKGLHLLNGEGVPVVNMNKTTEMDSADAKPAAASLTAVP